MLNEKSIENLMRILASVVVVFFIFVTTLPGMSGAETPKPPGAEKLTCVSLADKIVKIQNEYDQKLRSGEASGTYVGVAFFFGGLLGMAASQHAHNVEIEKIETLRKLASNKGCRVPPPLEPYNPPSWEEVEKEMGPE